MKVSRMVANAAAGTDYTGAKRGSVVDYNLEDAEDYNHGHEGYDHHDNYHSPAPAPTPSPAPSPAPAPAPGPIMSGPRKSAFGLEDSSKIVPDSAPASQDTPEPVTASKRYLLGPKQVKGEMGSLDNRPRGPLCCGLINPESRFFQRWDLYMIVLLLFTSIVTPFEVAFLTSDKVDGLFLINRVVDLSFLVDMIFQFKMPFKAPSRSAHDGNHEVLVWVVDRWRIAKRYLTSWFIIDLISILPFDSLGLMVPSIKRLAVFRILRVIRLVKLLRAMRASGIVTKYQVRLNISFAITKLFKFIILVFIICHWMACLWRLIPLMEGGVDPAPGDRNWVSKYYGEDYLSVMADTAQLYLASFYWSVMTATTIGYGDITPDTPAELAFAAVSMAVGGAMYAYVVGGICGIIATLDPIKVEFQNVVDNLNSFMQEQGLPRELQIRLRTFFFESKQLMRDRAHAHTVRLLPPSLCHEVMSLTSVKFLSRIDLFQLCPGDERQSLMVQLSLAMHCKAYAQGDCLFRVGQRADKMCIIQRGVCVKIRGAYAHTLVKGSVVGSEMIVCSPARTVDYKVQVLTFVLVHKLLRRVVQGIIDSPHFAASKKALRKRLLRDIMGQEFRRYAEAYKSLFGMRRDQVQDEPVTAHGRRASNLSLFQEHEQARRQIETLKIEQERKAAEDTDANATVADVEDEEEDAAENVCTQQIIKEQAKLNSRVHEISEVQGQIARQVAVLTDGINLLLQRNSLDKVPNDLGLTLALQQRDAETTHSATAEN